MKKSILLVAFSGALATCMADMGGAGLEILYAPAFDQVCTISTNAQAFYSAGYYDPGYPQALPAYAMPMIVRNNLEANAESNPSESFKDLDLSTETNNIFISGFDTCWYRGDDPRVSGMGSFDDGPPIECSSLPNDQKAFIASSITVDANLGEAALWIWVLRPEHLRVGGMFGPNFDAQVIPVIGQYYYDRDGDLFATDIAYSHLLQSPSDPARSPAWGTYPTDSRTFRVIVQARAVGATQSGRSVKSNWFTFPVDLCVGCQTNVCGEWLVESCSDAGAGYQGQAVNTEVSCLVAQAGNVVCENYDSCPETTTAPTP